jgi:hypothetical protein
LKLFALLLALVMWLTLIPEEKTFSETTLVVPLETRNLPNDFELVERPEASIDVTVRAPNRMLSQMTGKDVQAVLNLSRVRVDQEDYPLNPDMITVPPGAQVVRVFPNKVRLKVERSVEVSMDVQYVLVGKVKEGFALEKAEVVPVNVNVRGPESKFKVKEKVRTTPVDVTDLTESASFVTDLILPRPELRFASGQTKATVIVTIAKK